MDQSNPFGFKIIEEKEKHRIVFYMVGPDQRYNGREYILKKEKMNEFCEALLENYELYLKEKTKGTLNSISGKMGMTIRFGLIEGICFGGIYGQIRSEKKLMECISYIKEIKKII